MTTIINGPGERSSDEGMGIGLILGILMTALFATLFFFYGLPMLRNTNATPQSPQTIEIKIPTPTPSPQN